MTSRSAVALILVALAATPALATVKDGYDAWQKGDYASAVAQWKDPAAAGDADAQFNLAQAYKLGRGVPMDIGLAESWYRKAAEQGHELAQANLGLILFQKGDRPAAMPWLEKSADRGEPRAQYVVGTALFNGDLLPRDWPRAYAMMTQAAAAGLPQAKNSLAQMDKYIPQGDRQKGLIMAQTMQKSGTPTALAANSGASRGHGAPAGIAATPLPPSAPAQSEAAATPPAPTQVASAAPTPKPRTAHKSEAAAPPPPAPSEAKPHGAALAASGGKWKVQLGAYSSEAGAHSAWRTISGKASGLAGLSPAYQGAGKVTRLQAGPLASKAAAEKACALAKAAGSACFPVAP